MAPQDYLAILGDEVDGGDWLQGSELDAVDDGGGWSSNMDAVNDMGNDNGIEGNGNSDNNGNNGNRPSSSHPQNSDSSLSTTNSPATANTYPSITPTDTATTSAFTTSSITDTITSTSTNIPTTTTKSSQTETSESSSLSLETSTSTPLPETATNTQYTGLNSPPPKPSTHPTLTSASIAGLIIGILSIFALILATLWYLLRLNKKKEEHRKDIRDFETTNWNGTEMERVPPYQSRTKPSMGVQRVLIWSMTRCRTHSRSQSIVSVTSACSQDTLRDPFVDHNSTAISNTQTGQKESVRDERKTDENKGAHENIVDFGDSIDWIRNRDRRRDRERGRLPFAGPGKGSVDWRYSVRINGGGNNL